MWIQIQICDLSIFQICDLSTRLNHFIFKRIMMRKRKRNDRWVIVTYLLVMNRSHAYNTYWIIYFFFFFYIKYYCERCAARCDNLKTDELLGQMKTKEVWEIFRFCDAGLYVFLMFVSLKTNHSGITLVCSWRF